MHHLNYFTILKTKLNKSINDNKFTFSSATSIQEHNTDAPQVTNEIRSEGSFAG